MKIIINPDNLICDDNFQVFHKVRAIIENEVGEFIISNEGGKYIFPGGKREKGETNIEAIQREIKEETGIELNMAEFTEILELETLYKNFYDYRSDTFRQRYTSTIYYYAKCSDKIDASNMNLTPGEINEGFRIAFVDKESLLQMLSDDHSLSRNGTFFDEENKIVVDIILKDILSSYSKQKKK
jgi:8-oxo-dGTP pyrophosphatase MutT (NUDIX family)